MGNSWPKTRDLSRGMQTRANVLYLPRSFLKPGECVVDHPDRQRPELWDRVYANEMAGVLNRLIAAYYQVVARKGFMPPESACRAFEMWLADANVVARFIEEGCEKISADKAQCITTMFYAAFTNWCDENGVQPCHRPQQNQVSKRVEELGYRVKHGDHGTHIYGIKIKAEWYSGRDPFNANRLKIDLEKHRKQKI